MIAENAAAKDTVQPCNIVVIGAGFTGVEVIGALRGSNIDITLADHNSHPLFQPLLFGVATSILELAEISEPNRSLFRKQPNNRVEMREAKSIDLARRVVIVNEGSDLDYDILVVTTGARTSYFGHEAAWAEHAPGLKSLGDAIIVRNRLLRAFESAEIGSVPVQHARDMTVFVVGSGPGVATSGQISALTKKALASDLRNINLRQARLVLVESGLKLLPAFSERHSAYAARTLERQGIEIKLGVTDGNERIEAATAFWCTGVRGMPVARLHGTDVKQNGTVAVCDDFSLPGHPECFVLGNAAHMAGPDGRPLPGLASIGQHQGRYVGNLIAARLANSPPPKPCKVLSPSKIATISRHVGVAKFSSFLITGFPAWLIWGPFHLRTLSDARAKLTFLADWLPFLVTYRRGARIIVEQQLPS